MKDQDDHSDEVRRIQAEAMANLEKLLAKAETKKDPLRLERRFFAAELSRARRKKKLSQAELASKLGMKQPNISNIENSKSNPGLNTLLAIAKALDVNLVLE